VQIPTPLELAQHLVHGNDVNPIIGCLGDNTEFKQAAKNANIKVIELNIKNISSFNVIGNLKSLIEVFVTLKKHKIDLVQSVDPLGFRYAALGSFLAGVPTAFHFHYPYSDEALHWYFNKLPKARHFIFCCDSIRNRMGSALKAIAPQAKLTTIHNGINLKQFSSSSSTGKNSPKNIAIVGNLQQRKGHKDFLHMAKLLEYKQDLKFHVIGDDVSGENNKVILKELCKTLNIEKSIVFHGFVNNVHQLLSDMDILVCASYEEAFPLNILEAMALGIPEAIKDGVTGLLVETNSPAELAGKVSYLIENNDERIRIIENASQLVQSSFSADVFSQKFLTFYNTLTKAKS
jgi:glycosyltransferase involved in cell wall biosynthesis